MRELKVSKCSPRFGQTDSRRPFKLTYANRQWPPSSQSVSQSVAFALLCPEWKLASRRLKLMIQGARKKGRKEGAWARGTAGVDSNSSYETIQFNGAFPTAMECISSSCYSFRGSGSLVGKESIPLLNQKEGNIQIAGVGVRTPLIQFTQAWQGTDAARLLHNRALSMAFLRARAYGEKKFR